ncbi:hypothetical protein EYC84_000398 [Monilinia fructicola]|uniref:SEC7 domain-containing protein n=1 Tax=Monilinia fructicola TaxID=38448 RepID=A0A5M9JTA5_MONFR|nr:hypothetical protein EYC84_000398 [Monilinia fructicola]
MVSVAVDPVALITTECITVTSAMRKHARWAHSSVSSILGGPRRAPRGSTVPEGNDDIGLANRWGLRGKKGKSMQDNPLMAGFGRLRRELTGCKDIHTFDTPSFTPPFSSSHRSSGNYCANYVFGFGSHHEVLLSLSAAMTHCRFEASDTVADEVVFLRILKLMEGMLSGPGGDLLSDGSVCEMMETGLSMCCQPKLSELVRRSAEMSMIKMCQIIFERLKHLEIEAGDDLEALDEKTKEDMDTVKMAPSAAGTDAITKLPHLLSNHAHLLQALNMSRPASAMEKVPLLETPSEGVPQAPKLVKASSGRSTPVPVKDRRTLGLEGGSRKPDAREAMVESVGALARIPSYMVELYVNYDCEVDRSDICEDMVGLLSRNAIPDSATWSTTSVPPLCLDALLDQATLREQKRRKKIIIQGTIKFNENPKAGIAFLASQGIIDDPKDAKTVANFLKGTSRVDKKQLGEFISKKGNEPILEALMDSFDFENKRVDEALRELLETFRLPGESALIERIITTFSENYCSGTLPEGIADKDSHNPNMKGKRMELENFARNLRGVNGGKDFAPEYLQDIYESIKSNEIILPDEHDNKHAFDYAWKELLLKTTSAGDLTICDTNIFDADMFAATWKPVVATLSYVFMSASDDAVFERVIAGFDQCVRIAAKYGLTEVIDQVVYCLSYITTLATETPSSTALNTEIQVGEDSVMVSELAVKFGRDVKAQLATVVLFRVVRGSEGVIGESWKHISRIWLNLFVNSLIPPFFATSNSMDIASIPLQNPSQVIDRGAKPSDTGLFSTLSSYLASYTADDPPEPSDEELESTLCTVDCVNACYLGDIFANIVNMPVGSLRPLLQALISQLPDDPSSVVISVKSEVEPPSSPTNGINGTLSGPVYDPSMVYVLELCTVLATRDNETINAFGADVAEALQNVIRNSSSWHYVMVSRTIFYLLHLLHASYEQSYIRVPVVLHAISSFKKDLFEKSATLVLQGLTQCIKEPGPLRNEIMTSPDFWAILKNLATSPSTSAVFEILEGVAIGSPPTIMADNYESAVKLLNDFATAGSVGSTVEQKQDKRTRRGQPVKQPKPQVADAVVARGQRRLGSLLVANFHGFDGTMFFFPLITRLLKPEVYSSDPIGMSENSCPSRHTTLPDLSPLSCSFVQMGRHVRSWLKILDIMDRLMNSGQGDSLEEAVPESLKNVLLVMSSSGYLVPKNLREEIDLEGPGVEENVKGGVIPTTASNSEAEQVQSEIKA